MRRSLGLILAFILLIACSGCFWDRGGERGGRDNQDRGGHGEHERGGSDGHDRGGYGGH